MINLLFITLKTKININFALDNTEKILFAKCLKYNKLK